MAIVELTVENFAETVSASEIVLVDFWAGWCGPCRRFRPIFEEASERHPELVFGTVDTEAQEELAAAFQVRSIPTLLVVRDQVVLFAQAGAFPRDALESLIEQVQAIDMEAVRAELAARSGDPVVGVSR